MVARPERHLVLADNLVQRLDLKPDAVGLRGRATRRFRADSLPHLVYEKAVAIIPATRQTLASVRLLVILKAWGILR
jgi:hypothetical protein